VFATAADYNGAKSSASRVNPVGSLADPSRYLIFASNGGAPSNPALDHDLRAKPRIEIEVGPETIDVVATEAPGEERERLFRRAADRFPDLAEHARRTGREIFATVLTPSADA
jgi:F420H(2)-dependent quinone reductase